MAQRSNRPLLTAALIAGLTVSVAAAAQDRDRSATPRIAHDIGAPSAAARDQITMPNQEHSRGESDGAYVPGQESLSQCPLVHPESIVDVARSYPNSQIRVMTATEFFASEEATSFEHAPPFGCGDKRQSIYIIFHSNRFELGAEQTVTVTDAPNPPFDGTLSTPQWDLPPDLPRGTGGTTTVTVFGGAARDAGPGPAVAGGSQGTRQLASPPPACGEPSDALKQAVENTIRTMEGIVINYDKAVGQRADPIENSIVVEKGGPTLPEHVAWRAPGVRTKAQNSVIGCFQAGIAQDLRWQTGKPYVAMARVARIGLVSFEASGGSGPRGEEGVLKSYYGFQNHLLKYRFSDVLRPDQFQRRGWIPVTKQQLDQLISEYGSRGGHPRGLVSLGYENSSIGHIVNVRWNGAGQVELWDASVGLPADLSHVNKYWFFPTN